MYSLSRLDFGCFGWSIVEFFKKRHHTNLLSHTSPKRYQTLQVAMGYRARPSTFSVLWWVISNPLTTTTPTAKLTRVRCSGSMTARIENADSSAIRDKVLKTRIGVRQSVVNNNNRAKGTCRPLRPLILQTFIFCSTACSVRTTCNVPCWCISPGYSSTSPSNTALSTSTRRTLHSTSAKPRERHYPSFVTFSALMELMLSQPQMSRNICTSFCSRVQVCKHAAMIPQS